MIFIVTSFIVLPLTPAKAAKIDVGALKKAFDGMARGLKEKKEPLFSVHWDPRGYAANLVGDSGIPGRVVYRQGSRKGWFFKPDLSAASFLPGQLAGPIIVPCAIWSAKKGRAVGHVHALLIANKRGRLVLGAGEKKDEVIALGQRYVSKKKLASTR